MYSFTDCGNRFKVRHYQTLNDAQACCYIRLNAMRAWFHMMMCMRPLSRDWSSKKLQQLKLLKGLGNLLRAQMVMSTVVRMT